MDALPAFTDNYLWLIHNGIHAAVVDPGDAVPVLRALQADGLQLCAILVTHHHPDHIGGVSRLVAETGATVYGPAAEAGTIRSLDRLLHDGDQLTLDAPQMNLEVLAVPGHTLGHIAYYAPGPGLLFCGDTLFSAGCGRLFEGTPEQMHVSLRRLAELPPDTAVYCAHEYTLANLHFAAAVEPDNPDIRSAIAGVRGLRQQQHPSLPSSIGRELRINPFMRCRVPAVREIASQRAGRVVEGSAVFAVLRAWKDNYRAPLV